MHAGQPLIGAAGRKVRAGIIGKLGQSSRHEPDRRLEPAELAEALQYALLTNLVPFKPVGNKAYSDAVRSRFRPFLERLLADYWTGQSVITLGAEAFEWFRPYAELGAYDRDGPTETRFERVFRCRLPGQTKGRGSAEKSLLLYPLPHPSPLNRRWFARFPEMLAERLTQIEKSTSWWTQAN